MCLVSTVAHIFPDNMHTLFEMISLHGSQAAKNNATSIALSYCDYCALSANVQLAGKTTAKFTCSSHLVIVFSSTESGEGVDVTFYMITHGLANLITSKL